MNLKRSDIEKLSNKDALSLAREATIFLIGQVESAKVLTKFLNNKAEKIDGIKKFVAAATITNIKKGQQKSSKKASYQGNFSKL